MKAPRIPIWLPLVGMLSTFTIFSLLAYHIINGVLEKNLVNRKTPDSILLKKVFTSPVPADIDDEAAKMATMRGGISGAHRNTLVQVYDYKPDGGVVPLVNNEFDVPGKIPFEVQKIATDMLLVAVSEGRVEDIRKGERFNHKGVDYHVISQEFPLDRKGRMGEVILLTNIDSSLKETRDQFIAAKTTTFLWVTAWGIFALVINVSPVNGLTRQVRAGRAAKTAWWAPQPIEDLAAQLNLDKAANDQYRNEVALERKMVEIAPVMLVRCKLPKLEEQAIFTYVNPAVKDQLGWPVLIGQPLNTIVPPQYGGYHTWLGLYDEDLKRDVGMASCPMHNHKSRVVEAVRPVQAITAIGEVIDVLLSVQLLEPDEDGSLNFAGTMIDVTPLVNARSKAEQLAEQIKVVNHIAVHDIKSDLTALLRGSEVIGETIDELIEYLGEDAEPVTLEAIEAIKFFSELNIKSSNNAFEVLDQRNKLYDLESKIEIAPCDVSELLSAIEAGFTGQAGEVRIYNDCPAGRSILADFSLLLGVLKNIVRNGFIHNDSALKRVEVRVEPGTTSQRTRISIEDNGVGMPSEYLENWGQTMGKAAQLDTGRGGSGTGLYSIRAVMNAHKNASIEITSTVGSGTKYTLEFNHVA